MIEKTCKECGTCLEPLPFLSGFPEKTKIQLTDKAVRKTFRQGSTIFREGETVDAVYMIQKGKVKLARWDADGREQIIGIFSETETIWEGLLIEDSTFPYSAQCLTPVSACILYGADLMDVLREPEVSMQILTMLSRKLHDANERNLVLSTRDPKARLAAFLLYREQRDKESIIQIKLDDISASLNLRPETVSRKLKDLIDDGLVKRVGKSGIRILDFEGLEELKY